MRFDTENEKEDTGFEPIPPGIYRVMVEGVAMKANKSGNGRHVSVKLGVIEGSQQKRKLFCNFNVENSNEKAQQIGRAQMKSFLKAIGIFKSIDLVTELPTAATDKTLYVDVVHETGRDGITREAVKKFNATLEASPASKAVGAAYQPPSQTKSDPLGDIPF